MTRSLDARVAPGGEKMRILLIGRGTCLSAPLAQLALAAENGASARTCGRVVARSGLPWLANVDRVTGGVRRRGSVAPVHYERERPGELIHVDVEKVARIPGG